MSKTKEEKKNEKKKLNEVQSFRGSVRKII